MTGMLVPGTYVHEWKILRHLGEGRHGALYAVERAGRPFVLKWLAPSAGGNVSEPPELLVEREAACLKLLAGPLFVGLAALGRWPEEGGSPFLVLQAVEGMKLTRWSEQHGPTPRDMLGVFLGIIKALSEMHRRGVRYPNLTSDDFTVRKGRLELVLTDMGGAFPSWGAITTEEQGEDIHAVGVMFYRALTRQSPGPNAPPPHLINPRVPPALGLFAMMLLAPGAPAASWM